MERPSAPAPSDPEALLHHADDLLAEADRDGRYAYASPSHEIALGRAPADLIGTSCVGLIHREDRDCVIAAFQRAIRQGRPERVVCRIRHADGSWRWFDTSGKPFETPAGDIHLALVARDISAKRSAEEALRASEERTRVLIDTLPSGVCEIDPAGHITFTNAAFDRIVGAGPGELMGSNAFELLASDPEQWIESFQAAVGGERLEAPSRFRIHTRDGREALVSVVWNVLRRTDGSAERLIVVVNDLTESSRTADDLATSRRFIERVAEASPSILAVADLRQQSIVYVNARVEQILGFSAAHVLEQGFAGLRDRVHPDDHAVLAEIRQTELALADGEVVEEQHRFRHGDGDWRWLRTHRTVFQRDEAGVPTHVLSVIEDVTGQQQALEALRVSAERHRLLTENASDMIMEFDFHGRFTYLSPNLQDFTEGSVRDSLHTPVTAFLESHVHPEDREMLSGRLAQLMDSGRSRPAVYRMRRRDGSWRWLDGRVSTYRTADGEMRAVAINRDVTESKLAEEALRLSEERFRLLTENAYDYISELGPTGRVLYISPSVEQITGYAPELVLGRDLPRMTQQVVHEDDRHLLESMIERVAAGEPVAAFEYRFRHRDGRWLWLETYTRPFTAGDGSARVATITRDVTARRRAESEARSLQEQLLQAQKLESLGVLAGGIAHDFNNLLVGILGNASLAVSELPEGSPVHETLEAIETAALRAAELTNQMLAYSGRGQFVVEPLDLTPLIREMAHLVEASISKRATLRFQLDPQLPSVRADATQLRQLVMNLLTNASDALGDSDGAIVVRTGLMEPSQDGPPLLPEADDPAGAVVFLEVADSGCGMDEATRSRIFDPFFTTKFTGRGLGLAAALGIVRAHRGRIEVQSRPGQGTTVRVRLPASKDPVAEPVSPGAASAEHAGGEGTLLVVDDEEVVRRMATRILERAGYRVLAAADGVEGMAVFREHADEIQAALVDMTMPRLGGVEVVRQIRALRPEVRVVLTSGYTEREASQRFEGQRLDGFLQKPFRPQELTARIRAALDGDREA